jgi:type IV secretory pathway TraG/TraD family ATPase VirD4
LLAGSTNTGKSTGINELIASAIARGDRLIMVDPNGHSLARFYQKGDVVLNPFDKRSVQWSLFNEIRSEYDFEWLAKSVVPDSANATDQAWHGYAQQLLAGVLRAMMVVGENSTERLLYWVTQAPTEELAKSSWARRWRDCSKPGPTRHWPARASSWPPTLAAISICALATSACGLGWRRVKAICI